MKLLTLNFLTCAISSCKSHPSSFPLHIKDAELEQVELEFNELFLRNVLGRVEWDAMRAVLSEVGLKLPESVGEKEESVEQMEVDQEPVEEKEEAKEETSEEGYTEDTLKKIHELLMETQITSGKLAWPRCAHKTTTLPANAIASPCRYDRLPFGNCTWYQCMNDPHSPRFCVDGLASDIPPAQSAACKGYAVRKLKATSKTDAGYHARIPGPNR